MTKSLSQNPCVQSPPSKLIPILFFFFFSTTAIRKGKGAQTIRNPIWRLCYLQFHLAHWTMSDSNKCCSILDEISGLTEVDNKRLNKEIASFFTFVEKCNVIKVLSVRTFLVARIILQSIGQEDECYNLVGCLSPSPSFFCPRLLG